jgi:hypothetical protein
MMQIMLLAKADYRKIGCTLLSLIFSKFMTPFQGMHYGNTLGALV